MKKKNRAFAYIMGAAYVLLSLGILVSFTGAKYTDQRTVYPSFQAADFNVAMGQQSIAFDLTHLQPGMEGDAAAEYPFFVSNGLEKDNNVAESALKYTVRLRTSNSLPLDYYLIQTVEEETVQEDGTTKVEQVTYLYKAGQPEKLSQAEDDTAEPRYEYTFFPYQEETDEGNGNVDENEDTTENADNTGVALLSNAEPVEAEFALIPEQMGGYTSNNHTLRIEWPHDETQTDNLKYMKEVEMLELVVTAVSLNRLEDDSYIPETLPTEAPEDSHTPGVVFLSNNVSDIMGIWLPTYEIDLRAFYTEIDPAMPAVDADQDTELPKRIFQFYMDNGVGYGETYTLESQYYDRTYVLYDITLMVPMEKVETRSTENPEEKTVTFKRLDFQYAIDGTVLELDHYRIYNLKTGEARTTEAGNLTIMEYQNYPENTTLEEEEWVFAVYSGFNNARLSIFENGTQTPAKNLHTLSIQGKDVTEARITELAHFYKLKMDILAKYQLKEDQDATEAVPDESEETETDENTNNSDDH